MLDKSNFPSQCYWKIDEYECIYLIADEKDSRNKGQGKAPVKMQVPRGLENTHFQPLFTPCKHVKMNSKYLWRHYCLTPWSLQRKRVTTSWDRPQSRSPAKKKQVWVTSRELGIEHSGINLSNKILDCKKMFFEITNLWFFSTF